MDKKKKDGCPSFSYSRNDIHIHELNGKSPTMSLRGTFPIDFPLKCIAFIFDQLHTLNCDHKNQEFLIPRAL